MIIPDEKLFPEQWIQLICVPVCSIYSISSYGRVYNSETNRYLPQNVEYSKDKYITISLRLTDGNQHFFQTHRLVLMAFDYRPGCDSLIANHKDGIKYHNWVWNLEWTTPSGNVQHAIKNNLFNLGETRENTILSNDQVHCICQMIQDGKTDKEIICEMNLQNCRLNKILQNIRAGLSWKHISCQYNFEAMYRKKPMFTDSDIHKICKYLQDNGRKSQAKEILSVIGIDYDESDKSQKANYSSILCSIRNKEIYKNIVKDYTY